MSRHLIRFYNLDTVVVGTKCLTRILQFCFFIWGYLRQILGDLNSTNCTIFTVGTIHNSHRCFAASYFSKKKCRGRDAKGQHHVFTLAIKNRAKMFEGLPCIKDKYLHGIVHKRQAGILHCG